MAQESRLAIVIDSRTAEQRAKDLKTVLEAVESAGDGAGRSLGMAGESAEKSGRAFRLASRGVGLLAATLVGAFTAAAKSASGYMSEMGMAAERTSVTTETFSMLSYAAKDASLSQGELERVLRRSTEAINHAIEGGTRQAEALKTLGISAYTASGQVKTADQMLISLVDRFSKLEPGARKTGLVLDLFGQQLGQKVIPFLNLGADGIAKLSVEAENLGLVVDNEAAQAAIEFETHLSRMADSVKGLAVDIGAELLPGINDYIESTTRASESTHILVGAASVVGNNFREIAAIGSGVATIFAARWALTGAANIGSYVLALTRSTQAMGAAAGAARALSAALGVVGGPIGAISLALGAGVTAWQLWGSEAGQARISATDLKKEVEELRGELDKLNVVQLEGKKFEVQEQYELIKSAASEAGIALQALERDYQDLLRMQQQGYNITEKELDNLRRTINELQQELIESGNSMTRYANLLVEIENAARRAAGGVDELNSSVSSKIVDDFIADAEERMRRMRMGVSAVARAQEIIKENPSLDPKQKEAILEIARAEDALRNSLRKTTSTVKTQIDEGQRYIQQLHERIALLGKETEYERLLAQMSVGAINFKTQAQEQEAIAQAQTLDFLEEQMRAVEEQLRREEDFASLKEQQLITQRQFNRELEAMTMTGAMQDLHNDLVRVEDRYRAIIEAWRNSPLGLSEEDLEEIRASMEAEFEIVREFHEAKMELQQDWVAGAVLAVEEYVEEASNLFAQMHGVTAGAFKGMEDALVSYITTGKMQFADFARSVIADMVRMTVQAMVLGPLMRMMGFGGGGLFSSGGLVGGALPGATTQPNGLVGVPLPGLSDGGYTGDGGKYEPAGIVHRGEYVFSKEAVNRLGVGTLERLHRSGKGYAIGGLVGGGGAKVAAQRPMQVVVNISTPDADSFRRSESQIQRQLGMMTQRALSRV